VLGAVGALVSFLPLTLFCVSLTPLEFEMHIGDYALTRFEREYRLTLESGVPCSGPDYSSTNGVVWTKYDAWAGLRKMFPEHQ
jgi:hypothetical protein